MKSVNNPFEQARHYAEGVVDALKRAPQSVQPSGKWQVASGKWQVAS